MTDKQQDKGGTPGDFSAVCRDCGTIRDESFDHQSCSCGGVFHVDSAHCDKCGMRHPFSMIDKPCSCEGGGKIVPKVTRCPSCQKIASIEHLGEFCGSCNVQLVMEG